MYLYAEGNNSLRLHAQQWCRVCVNAQGSEHVCTQPGQHEHRHRLLTTHNNSNTPLPNTITQTHTTSQHVSCLINNYTTHTITHTITHTHSLSLSDWTDTGYSAACKHTPFSSARADPLTVMFGRPPQSHTLSSQCQA